MEGTRDQDYTERLQARSGARWKRWLRVQAPYRLRLRAYQLGRTLDVGCGIGRMLQDLPEGSVGVDHNPTSIEVARRAGMSAMTAQEWQATELATSGSFEALLFSHILEHLDRGTMRDVVDEYLPALRPGGRVLVICPQGRGYASDPTHVTYLTDQDISDLLRDLGLHVDVRSSFPLPAWAGRRFTYNEFHVLATKPAG